MVDVKGGHERSMAVPSLMRHLLTAHPSPHRPCPSLPAPAACVAIFLICLAATGSPWSATLIILTLCMLLVDIMGAMALLGIQLNAGEGHAGGRRVRWFHGGAFCFAKRTA